jgi:hypothetical protein
MPRCPFATWHPLSGGVGRMNHDPAKIVHHTTEGSTAEGALSALGSAHADSHFVVGKNKAGQQVILQLIDTNEAARALRNSPGGVETNKDNAIQIEVVGFAGKAKDPATLANVANLCRWIEKTHGVARVWPNGFPKVAVRGQDPGGHNRNADNWVHKSGHYGHSQVPENTHWDPAYTPDEVAMVMAEHAVVA